MSIKKESGFTLTELLVVASIIILFSAIVLANYQTGNKQFALQRSAHKLAQDIRRAQEMAMSAKECEPCGNIVPQGYGIYSEAPNGRPTSYQLFADRNGDGRYFPANDTVIETINYESNVYLDNISVIGCSLPSAQGQRRAHFTFLSPDPETKLIVGQSPPNLAECSEITLTLSTGLPGQTKSIRVNRSGLIYVE